MNYEMEALDKEIMLEMAKNILKKAKELVKAIEKNDANAAFDAAGLYHDSNRIASRNIQSFRKTLGKY